MFKKKKLFYETKEVVNTKGSIRVDFINKSMRLFFAKPEML